MARAQIDIKVEDVDGGLVDLVVSGGDFVGVESTGRHQKELILNNKGDLKENPTVNVGAFLYLNDEDVQGLISAISTEFSRDGMDVKRVEIGGDGVLGCDAFYV